MLVITTSGTSQAVGTGWLMSPRLVVTAGHCVHEGAEGGFFKKVEVIPGMNGAQTPFGVKISSTLRASTKWKTEGSAAADYGAILLDEPFVVDGRSPASIQPVVLTDTELNQAMARISGYPADKPAGTQWSAHGVLTSIQPTRLRYLIDTFGGHSGSAVTRLGNDNAHPVIGIHNYGGCPNKCTRITQQVMNDLAAWRSEVEK